MKTLIADSGSTKCMWLMCNMALPPQEYSAEEFRTRGINAVLHTPAQIREALDELPPRADVGRVWFYGAGCGPQFSQATATLEAVVGPEFVTGYTRMKAGTAQKLILNMLSTAVMIRLGRVEGNSMVNMRLTNDKLVERGVRMIVEQTHLDPTTASVLLLRWGSVKSALKHLCEPNKELDITV